MLHTFGTDGRTHLASLRVFTAVKSVTLGALEDRSLVRQGSVRKER